MCPVCRQCLSFLVVRQRDSTPSHIKFSFVLLRLFSSLVSEILNQAMINLKPSKTELGRLIHILWFTWFQICTNPCTKSQAKFDWVPWFSVSWDKIVYAWDESRSFPYPLQIEMATIILINGHLNCNNWVLSLDPQVVISFLSAMYSYHIFLFV